MTHRLQVNMTRDTGQPARVLRSHRRKIPNRLMKLLFGGMSDVLVLVPGDSVSAVVIHEDRKEEPPRETV